MKRYLITPLALLIYLAFIAYFTYPGRTPGISYTQYYISIAVTIVIIAALAFFLKKKYKNKHNHSQSIKNDAD